MDQNRIDHVVRAPGTGRSRRSVLGAGAGLLAAAVGIGATRRAEAGWFTLDIAVYFVNNTSGDVDLRYTSGGNTYPQGIIPPGGRNTFPGDSSDVSVYVYPTGCQNYCSQFNYRAYMTNPDIGDPAVGGDTWESSSTGDSPIPHTFMVVGQVVEGPNMRIERNSDGDYFQNYTFTVF